MEKESSYEKLIIHFDTGPIPPPFCYRYTIKINNASGKFVAALDLEYYDRDEITEEEIFDEGFTLDDNFQWQGEIPEIWGIEIQKKLSLTNFIKNPTEDQDSVLELRIIDKGKSEILFPSDQKVWEVFAQEIMQAIFEISKKESPLIIQYLNINPDKKEKKFSMTFYFSTREVKIRSSIQKQPYTIHWKEGQKLLQYIYFFDYLPETALIKSPNKPGSYLDPGDGNWYSMTNGERSKKINDRKEKLLVTLNSYF